MPKRACTVPYDQTGLWRLMEPLCNFACEPADDLSSWSMLAVFVGD